MHKPKREKHLTSLIVTSADWHWEQDDQLRFVSFHGSLENSTGCKPESLIGKRRWDVPRLNLTEQDWIRHRTQLERRETFRDFEMCQIRPDGRESWVAVSGAPVLRPDGRFEGYVGIGKDITTQKMAEQALRENDARFRALALLASDWCWEQDEQFRFTLFFGAFEQKAGLRPDEYIGKTRWDRPAQNLTDEDWARHRALLERHEPFKDFEIARIDVSGRLVWTSTSGTPIFDANGKFKGYRGIGKDISAQKAAELELRESEERFRVLTELSSDWYWEQDEHFRFTSLTRDSRHGANNTNNISMVGKHRWDAPWVNMTPQDWERHKAQLERHEVFRDLELCNRKADGQLLWCSVSGAPIFDRDGNFKGYRGRGKNITARKLAEHELRNSEARFRDLTELSSDWFWELGPDLRFTDMHGGASDGRMEFLTEDYTGKFRWDLPYIDVPTGVWEAHKADLEARRPFFDLTLKRRLADGSISTVSISGKPMFDKAGVFIGYRGVGKDITERTKAQERIQYLATHDALTGLPNRTMFSELLNLTMETGRRYGRTFALLFLDLDRFKNINDTFGHEAGDELLIEMSKRLQSALRSSDVVARLGGDEFVVLVQEVESEKQISAIARKVLASLIKPAMLMGHECRITASIGISMFPKDADNEQSLMKNADIAMYHAKEEGRNNFQFYSEHFNVHTLERLALETSLRRALEQDEFSLHYQAKQGLKHGEVTGAEALLRWNHPEFGMVSPAQFIPLAEETGLIVPIGRWVLHTVCTQSMAWQKQGLPPICMAINLSPRQFADDNLVKDIAFALQETGLQPELLELELTEGAVIQNAERAIKVLTEIKKMGIRLAIDDFGVGYSSLAQLKRFPIDTLKIDRSFIRDIPNVAEDSAITEAIIAMGRTLSLTVIAEGVETAEQKQFLSEHECDEMQGYFFSKPIEAGKFAEFLRKHLEGQAKKVDGEDRAA